MVWWNKNFISNDIIYEGRPHCAGIADIAYLYRRISIRENTGPAIFCLAFQIHRDINFILLGKQSDIIVLHVSDIIKNSHGTNQSAAHFVINIWSKRVGINLESISIMDLKEFCHQIHRRVIVKISLKITNS